MEYFLEIYYGNNYKVSDEYSGTTVSIGFTFTYTVSSSNVYCEAKPKIHVVKSSSYVNKDLYYWFGGSPSANSEVVHFS